MAVLRALHRFVWGPWTLAMILGTGLWFGVRSGWFPFRCRREWLGATVGQLVGKRRPDGGSEDRGGKFAGGGEKSKITQLQSVWTALAATIGTGNIVGVATALTMGGPGAIFWMWVSALLGMMTAYAETFLGLRYRRRAEDGHWLCGPMMYMERRLGSRWMGVFYAGLAVLASLGMGGMVQANSISATLESAVGIPVTVSAVALTLAAAAVIAGGSDRIARVAERLMPMAAGIYIVSSLAVVWLCAPAVPQVLHEILAGAFAVPSVGGGLTGFFTSRSLQYGLSRGVFSNEAGLGTLAVLHGGAEDTTPRQQGMWAMFEVFFDTIVICTLTALVILCVEREAGIPVGLDGAQLAAWCFAGRLGRAGEWLVSASMIVFAFATIIAWYYTGRQAAEYLAGERMAHRQVILQSHTACCLAAIGFGCLSRLDLVWLAADLCNGLMVYPNLLALWLLSTEVDWAPSDTGRNPDRKKASLCN